MTEIGRLPQHKTTHQKGGSDEIDATGLAGRVNYIDRGDPAGWDFQVSDLTTNGAWHDLDLSAIVPAGAKQVHISAYIQDDASTTSLSFRKKGNTQVINVLSGYVPAANTVAKFEGFVTLNAARIIEYMATNQTWSGIYIAIRGWLI